MEGLNIFFQCSLKPVTFLVSDGYLLCSAEGLSVNSSYISFFQLPSLNLTFTSNFIGDLLSL